MAQAKREQNDQNWKKTDDTLQLKDDPRDLLISYEEYITAIKSLKNLNKSILPKGLTFGDVLETKK